MTHNGTPSSRRAREGLERAVALRHVPGSGRAPWVVASGRGAIARRLVEIAAEHGVPVSEDPDLAALLALVDLGQEIPAELFQAVAEVIAFCADRGGALSDVSGEPGPLPSARREPGSSPSGLEAARDALSAQRNAGGMELSSGA